MSSLDLVFMGSAAFSVPTLAALLDAGHRVVAVYTQPPRPAGRGHRTRLSPVHAFADERGLAVRTPKGLRAADARDDFAALEADAAVVAAYGLILPQPILDAPRLGCFNVHASLLPQWRGAAPIHRAIQAGDPETGVTIMRVDAGLDTGPMLLTQSVPIGDDTTAGALHDILAGIGARLMVETLDGIAAGAIEERPQPAEGVTYAQKLDRDEGRLDWREPAPHLERTVRAFDPWPGTWFVHRGERIKVLAASIAEGRGEPGTILDDRLTIACGEGALWPLTLQRGGKSPVSTEAFLRGYPLPAGTRLD